MTSRSTKAFSAKSESGYPGSYPVGFLKWLRERGWWGEERIHLCCGAVQDPDSIRVDWQREIKTELREQWGRRTNDGAGRRTTTTTANLICDARDTGLESESFDWVGIDPPYSKDLARELYGSEEMFSGIDKFVQEGWRLLRPGGLLMTFSYAVPKRPSEDCEIIACWGIYQIPAVRYMTTMMIFKKPGQLVMGLDKWVK